MVAIILGRFNVHLKEKWAVWGKFEAREAGEVGAKDAILWLAE